MKGRSGVGQAQRTPRPPANPQAGWDHLSSGQNAESLVPALERDICRVWEADRPFTLAFFALLALDPGSARLAFLRRAG